MLKKTSATSGGDAPLRVLLVTPRYFPHVGGVQNHVYQVSRRLARAGVDATVLTTDTSGQLPTIAEAEGVKIRRVRAWPSKRDYYFAPDLYAIIKEGHWDVVHVQSYHTLVAPLAMLAAWRGGTPYVVTFHGGGHSSRLRNALRRIQRVMLQPLLARAARLVATAKFEIPFFGKQLGVPPEKFVFIPNGGDLMNVPPSEPAPIDEGLIVSIGRLEKYKGHQRVIAALPKVLEQRPDIRLWVAGAGPYQGKLQELANELGVAERVEIRAVPVAERERLAVELSRAALVVLLSEYETHPMAVLEAIALGRSVLVADTSGLSELAAQGLARALPLESSAEQVAEAILDQLCQPLVPPSFLLPTWDDCVTDLLALYKAISGREKCVS